MSEGAQTELADFKRVFLAANERKLKPVLVGGHAVNFWAYYYEVQEPRIKEFQPLISKDLDLLGTVEDLYGIADALNLSVLRMRPGEPNPVIGVIRYTTPSGISTTIEILHTLYGISNKEVLDGVGHVFSPGLDMEILVSSPLACLKAKTHNVLGFSQDKRQDLKHLRILTLCNRAFVRDAIRQAEKGRIRERAVVVALEALLRFTQSKEAQNAGKKYNLDWQQLFPSPELLITELQRVKNFSIYRLGKAFPGWKGRS